MESPVTTTDLSQALSDHDLVARACAGENVAINLLITAVRKAVLRYTRARLSTYSGGAEVAEDVTQEVCLAVVDVLPRYTDSGAPFAALVYAIASNKVADAQRRYARTPFHVVDELPDRAEPALGPEQQTMARSDVAAALALLERLPPRMAQVVRLRAEGLSADEVGAIVGLTANAVRVTQHRALARLRRLVADSADSRERFADRPTRPVAA
ncbi:sigma-70 family RNA polymerase sigma factor [Microlunatus antarcticus]|nr:sigma-70 family RNA polymerase sigma factor [Microlunatus antarcticus]